MAEPRTLTSVPPPGELRPLRVREFKRLRELIYAEAGIHLPDSKRSLVESRLSRRLRALRLRNFEDYCAVVSGADSDAERVQMLDCITTNETHFFREAKHFEFLERVAFPRWIEAAQGGERAKRLRIWSAACSTGEEPFTLAMCCATAFAPEASWSLEILASDISTRVLTRAQDATWPIEKAKEIPERYRRRFMLRGFGDREGELRAGPELRRLVRFARINLRRTPYTVGQLDLIFCRNVLIYFDAESRAQVIDAMVERLSPSGYLIVGHSESLHNVSRRVALVAPGVYVRSEGHERRPPSAGAP